MEQHGIVQDAWSYLEAELAELGYELIEVEYMQDYGNMILRLYIDSEDGINVDNCAEASRMVSALMDQNDFVGGAYLLEVSSPGVERPIRKATDFERFIGEPIKVKTVTSVEGRRRYKGILTGYADGLIEIDVDGTPYRVHIENVKKARLDH
ncbi:MAG: ribosome maturation factor RimP [Candidatus Hydrogenedentota bacterium]